jgi:hypothetical protein
MQQPEELGKEIHGKQSHLLLMLYLRLADNKLLLHQLLLLP